MRSQLLEHVLANTDPVLARAKKQNTRGQGSGNGNGSGGGGASSSAAAAAAPAAFSHLPVWVRSDYSSFSQTNKLGKS
jgi:hypothetical protein